MSVPIINDESFDVVILGAGIAGLAVALSLPTQLRTAIIAQNTTATSSHWAKGGVAAASRTPDSPARHLSDTLQAGGGLNDRIAVELMVSEAPDAIEFLRSLGVTFEETPEREAGHSYPRIWHADGDATGAAIMSVLGQTTHSRPNLTTLTGSLIRILTNEHGVGGVLIAHDKATTLLRTSKVVVATGGYTGLWSSHTSPATNLGIGMVEAYRAGALIADLEFTQFHPTAISLPTSPLLLATEALRGAGAWIIDDHGKRFIYEFDPAGELATRDIVSLAIYRHRQQAYLDVRPIGDRELINRFPSFVAACHQNGLDPLSQPIPIRPAAHYSMGGIVTNTYGETSVEGLYAVGECANTGVHGGNRLASNSLLEGVVFGRRAGLQLSSIQYHKDRTPYPNSFDLPTRAPRLDRLVSIVDTALGIERSGSSITTALESLTSESATEEMDPLLAHRNTAASLLVTLMLKAALGRTGSVGAHTRSDDCPEDANYRQQFLYGHGTGPKVERVRRFT